MSDPLESIDPRKVPKIPHRHERIPAKVYKVYDGDTVKIVFMHGGVTPTKISVRLLGIDTPEVRRNWDNPNAELESRAAKIVRDYAKSRLQTVSTVEMVDWDKYGGRVLGHLYLEDGSSLAGVLVEKKMAHEYWGGAKLPFTKEELACIVDNAAPPDL